MGVLLCVMWLIVFAIVAQLQSVSRASGGIMEGYIEITNFMNAFSAENIQMEAYVRPAHTEEEEFNYVDAAQLTDRYLGQMQPDLDNDSHEEYMLKRAITNAMVRYRADHNHLLEIMDRSETINQYLLLQRQATYINQYSWDLLQLRLLAGEERWRLLAEANRRNSRLILLYMGCGTAISILVVLLLLRSIVTPLSNLGRAADAIGKGDYEQPPLPEDRKDEIGRTAHSFNLMQNQVRRTFRAMEREAEMEKENARISQALQESRYAELQSQVNPHFLFNTLNTIAALAAEEGAPYAEDLILRLSKFFRYSLESREKTVKLATEVQVVRDYMELMDARFAGKINMVIEEEARALETEVPRFILQPVVENAIIHGLKDMPSGEIHLKIHDTGDAVQIKITDDGCGFDTSVLEGRVSSATGHTSVGLENIMERMKLFGGSAQVESTPGEGTRVIIRVPKEKTDD